MPGVPPASAWTITDYSACRWPSSVPGEPEGWTCWWLAGIGLGGLETTSTDYSAGRWPSSVPDELRCLGVPAWRIRRLLGLPVALFRVPAVPLCCRRYQAALQGMLFTRTSHCPASRRQRGRQRAAGGLHRRHE